MNKLSFFAAIASVGLALPALAQTPADIRNGRSTMAHPMSSGEVHIDHSMSNPSMGNNEDMGSMEKHHGGKHHAKHHAAAKHHAKHHGKHHGKKEMKKEDMKKDEKAAK